VSAMSDLQRKLASRVPPEVKRLVPTQLKRMVFPTVPKTPLPSVAFLKALQRDHYQVDSLVGITPEAFKERIDEFNSMDDSQMEGYENPDLQRQRSIKFEWSEDQDFGTFQVSGFAKNRAVTLLARFMDQMDGALPKNLEGKRVLDIGCWTGATSCLLAAMGASVVGVEEVKKYIECLTYLRDAFDITSLDPRNLSLYDLTAPEFQDAFDIVLFAGVLYHLSDPIIGLRITFDLVKPGGICLLETAVCKATTRTLEYAGSGRNGKTKGANWFFPSPTTVQAMMEDVGYRVVNSKVLERNVRNRFLAVGYKEDQSDMMRAGLSVPTIR
jgi:2-polyprenyl-3-methyl-5-hydroxy-6-metoxy-1,4-benzoquinol methylase